MSATNYQHLITNRIFIGGADDVKDVLENEKVDVVFDLRAEAPAERTIHQAIHCPIVDDEMKQDESIKQSIDQVVKAFNEGKNVYFHCQGGSNRTGTVAIGTLLSLGEASSIEEGEQIAQSKRAKIKVKPEMKDSLSRLFPNT
ncbi:protein-tyrosine phosphatase family protein [Bacillus sp. FJAT-45037]|uniref:protein-tyrosine phosphatase family protein n=1 Tax=Bacillus sp. FJAT-45037 TaxID=2011007 RepID=UPI000C23236B|nr:dual specificity protein phosphatase family protein [Bacillus sp. FJAT-45037]